MMALIKQTNPRGFWIVLIHGDFLYAGERPCEHVPARFFLDEIKKVVLSVHFELQLQPPIRTKLMIADI
jgi:hypothetical protein